MNPLDENVPVCPECQADLVFVEIEKLTYDGESHPFEVWRCNSCAKEGDGVQIDYHYPQGMFIGEAAIA
jgi:hypothetical protein